MGKIWKESTDLRLILTMEDGRFLLKKKRFAHKKGGDHVTVINLMYGNPVMTVKGITEQFHISDRTARKHMKEIEANRERYGDYAVMGEGALKRVNFLAFTDYWKWKKLLADKNGRKHVPEYNPQEIAREMGFYGREEL